MREGEKSVGYNEGVWKVRGEGGITSGYHLLFAPPFSEDCEEEGEGVCDWDCEAEFCRGGGKR